MIAQTDKNYANPHIAAGMAGIFVAIGANLPDAAHATPLQTAQAAITHLRALFPGAPFALSSFYSSAPVPASNQPRYINAMARITATADPANLLAALHHIESLFGRTRSTPNAARTLDLDLIDMNGQVLQTQTLTLPHPRAHLRLFVLLPLRDIAPNWRHPITATPINALINALPPADVHALDGGALGGAGV